MDSSDSQPGSQPGSRPGRHSSADSNLELEPQAVSLPIAARRRQADEWALVLAAEGFAPEVIRGPDGFRIEVAPEARAEASLILEAWQAERAERARRIPLPLPPSASALEVATVCVLATSLLVFHFGLEAAARRGSFIEIGASRAELVLGGEFWRLATALTLHSDLPHVLGNTLFGGFFLATLVGRLGVGLSILAFVTTGILGNLANALYYGSHHSSVGASTGVFGLVGVLTGLAAWRRHRSAATGRGGWVALAAGLGILAMLGTGGPKVDLSAHLFGLAAGALAGLLLAAPLASRPPPRRSIQILAFAGAWALIFGAWASAHP